MNENGTFWLPRAGSTGAHDVDLGWNLVFGVSVFFFLLVVGAMTYFVIRYRRRRHDELPQAPTHSTRLEIVWTVIPIFIVIGLFAVGFRGYLRQVVAPAESLEISVTAQRWMWTFDYANGTRSVNELRVPAGRPVKLVMSSKDVIHSFWVPEFRVKRDVVPGRYTSLWFEATEAGEMKVLCTEYCGTGHSNMLAKLVVMPDAEFQKWLESGGGMDKNLPPAELGKQLFAKMSCNTCHSVDGSAGTGPTLKGLFGHPVALTQGNAQADETYLRESIVNPGGQIVKGYQPVMPVFKGLLTQQQLDALVAYIKSLK